MLGIWNFISYLNSNRYTNAKMEVKLMSKRAILLLLMIFLPTHAGESDFASLGYGEGMLTVLLYAVLLLPGDRSSPACSIILQFSISWAFQMATLLLRPIRL